MMTNRDRYQIKKILKEFTSDPGEKIPPYHDRDRCKRAFELLEHVEYELRQGIDLINDEGEDGDSLYYKIKKFLG